MYRLGGVVDRMQRHLAVREVILACWGELSV